MLEVKFFSLKVQQEWRELEPDYTQTPPASSPTLGGIPQNMGALWGKLENNIYILFIIYKYYNI